MRAVLQRVNRATLDVDGKRHGSIDQGLVLLLGIEQEDTQEDIEWLTRKITHMRIFADAQDKMNLSVLDIDGEILIVSQFTLHASTKKGNRPSFIRAARPDKAIPLYERFIDTMKKTGLKTETGEFGANMEIHLSNDGPVTIIIDSKMRE